MKQHPSQHMLHQPNAVPGASARELHGTTRGNSTPGHLTAARLNAAQPRPISNQAGMGKTRDRPNAQGGLVPKRSSGAAGASKTSLLQQAQPRRSSRTVPTTCPKDDSPTNMNVQPQNGRPQEPQPSGFQKLMKIYAAVSMILQRRRTPC